MNEKDMSRIIAAVLVEAIDNGTLVDVAEAIEMEECEEDGELRYESALEDVQVEDFERGGVLSGNPGFTIKLADGSDYQVTIVQSKVGR